MKTLALVLLAALTGTAIADDAPLYWYERGTGGWPVMGSAALSMDVKDRVIVDMKLHPELPRGQWQCTIELMNSLGINWTCREVAADGTEAHSILPIFRSFMIENGVLVPITLDDVLRPRAEIRAAVSKLVGVNVGNNLGGPCPLAEHATIRLNEWQLEVLSDKPELCSYDWHDLVPLVKPNTTFAKFAVVMAARGDIHANRDYPKDPHATPDPRKPPPPVAKAEPAAKLAPSTSSGGRFAPASKDSIIDHASGLEWAARDNGVDLDADAAEAFAKAYRGGGHADWRLPTADELTALVTPELAHRETGDCTSGKNQYVITPLVHLTCGLVWTSTQGSGGTTGVGFISGNPRVSNRSDSKNYRALVVRLTATR